jgi:hypothetical protein
LKNIKSLTPYKYIASIEFINDLTFDYVETYSFQRGLEFEENDKLNKVEYDKLKAKKGNQNNLSVKEEVIFSKLDKLLGVPQYLLNDEGQFHYSSEKINTFKKNDQNLERIKNILQTEIVEIQRWLCAPEYRDALVFYNSDNKIVTSLNVCLSCQYMESSIFNHIDGDYKTYDLLKRFFIDIGHNVENPEYFPLDDLNKLKEKYKP